MLEGQLRLMKSDILTDRTKRVVVRAGGRWNRSKVRSEFQGYDL